VDVINRGFSGYNTKWGLMVIDAVVKETPDIVFICFGANDAIDETIAQHVSLDNYEKNINDMIRIISKVILPCKPSTNLTLNLSFVQLIKLLS